MQQNHMTSYRLCSKQLLNKYDFVLKIIRQAYSGWLKQLRQHDNQLYVLYLKVDICFSIWNFEVNHEGCENKDRGSQTSLSVMFYYSLVCVLGKGGVENTAD